MSAIPLPKLHPMGLLYSTEKKCEWWPNPVANEPVFKQVDDSAAGDPQQLDSKINDTIKRVNAEWIERAARHLVGYLSPVSTRRQYAGGHHGLMSAAITQVRNDQVVHGSVPEIEDWMHDGLRISHRDVLAAVGLLSQLDKNKTGVVFRPEAFESQDAEQA